MSNIKIAITPPQITRLRSNLVELFHHVTGNALQMFTVTAQMSRSKVKGEGHSVYSNVSAAKTL